MTELRLHKPEEDTPAGLTFPRIDWVNLRNGRANHTEPSEAMRLARNIERSIDSMQRRLEQVKDDLDAEVYHLPDPDDWPPQAA